MQFTAEMIAGFLGGEVVGDKGATVSAVAKIEEGKPGALAFLSNPKYEHYIYDTQATIVIVNRSFEPKDKVTATLVKVDDAYGAFAKLLELYVASKPQKKGVSAQSAVSATAKVGADCYIGEFAVLGENAVVGEQCKIYPQVYIGDNVRLGDNVTLHAGVKIYEECVIGNNVIIHSGTVIGGDGFGFAPKPDGTFEKIPQIGNVVIEDNVEIGSNVSIDRATMGSTVIKKGVKLDNLIQIAHNVVIGENTVIASQAGIAGSTKIGANCMFGGQVGIIGHLTIGDRVQIASQSGIGKNIADGESYMGGTPAMPASKFSRIIAVHRHLPEMAEDIRTLKKEVEALKGNK